MNKIKSLLANNFFVLLIFLIEIILFIVNYNLGTYFLGWDNLFPEMNFPENIARSFFGVWQESRGLGLLDGMSFSANITHYIFLYVVSFILPLSILRYFFVFLMHLLGGLGIYLLLKKNIIPAAAATRHTSSISFIGAFFYMFSLITVQMFYAPYELFLVHYGFLPWLIHYLIEYLDNPKINNLIKFSVFSFLSISQAHVPTIFLTYILFISIFLLSHLIKSRLKDIRRVIVIGLVIFAFNSFWGLPFVYSSLSNSGVIIDAKINQLSNENVYLKNKARGGLFDVLYMRGFLLDEIEVSKDGNFKYIMQEWRNHVSNPLIIIISTFILLITLVGVIKGVSSRNNSLISLAIAFLIFFVLLATDTPVAREVTEFVRERNNIFREIFRFSFTKFSIIFTFCYVIFFCLGLAQSINFITKKYSLVFGKVLLASFFTLLTIYSFPSFSGNFIYSELRVNVPDEYFRITHYLKGQNANSRIATLPQPSFWSWVFYRWGARGSGFIWYGIPQPMMERAFDPWSDKNENYYWELSYALYSNDSQLFQNVLEKYHIEWILIDKNLYNPSSYRSLFFKETDSLLDGLNNIKPVKKEGNLTLYKVDVKNKARDFVLITSELVNVLPEYKWNNYDSAFDLYGVYKSDSADLNNALYLPFRSLFTGKNPENSDIKINETQESIIFSHKLPEFLSNHQLEIPEFNPQESLWIDQDNHKDVGYYIPKTGVINNQISVEVSKKEGYLGKIIDPSKKEDIEQAKKCEASDYPDSQEVGFVKNDILKEAEGKFLRLTSVNAKNCSASYWIPNLPQKLSYLIKVKSRNITGKGLSFWVENTTNKKSDIESYLPQSKKISTNYFILPPMKNDGIGYTLHFDNVSIGNFETVNDLLEIEILPIPFNLLANLRFKPKDFNQVGVDYETNYIVNHPFPFLYKVKLTKADRQRSLILSQSFHQGWIMFDSSQVPYIKIDKHFMINNWANGWTIDKNISEVTILFWPQLLEFLGFIIMALAVGMLVLVKIRSKINR